MKKILITGANGQLGKAIEHIHKKYSQFQFTFVNKNQVDITNKKEIEKTLKDLYDICINCAAYTNVDKAEEDPKSFEINAKGAEILAKECQKKNIILTHISTSFVFDGKKGSPYFEGDLPNPINKYGKSKMLGEEFVQKILKKHYIIRTSWLYSLLGKNFFSLLLKEFPKDNRDIFADNSQIGNPTKTEFLAKSVLDLLEINAPFGIYHCTGAEKTTAYEYTKKMLKKRGLTNKLFIDDGTKFPRKAQRPKYDVLSNEKINFYLNKKS